MHHSVAKMWIDRRVCAGIARCFVRGSEINGVEVVPAFIDECTDRLHRSTIFVGFGVLKVGTWEEARAKAIAACGSCWTARNRTEVRICLPELRFWVDERNSSII